MKSTDRTSRGVGQRRRRLHLRTVGRVWVYLILLAVVVISLTPVLLIWLSAFKTNIEIFRSPIALPLDWSLENLIKAWSVGRFSTYAINSATIGVCTTTVVVLGSVMGGYALSIGKVPASRLILGLFVAGITIPVHGILIPQYMLMHQLGLLDSLLSVIVGISALMLPIGILLMRGFFRNLPIDIFDAARLDGCNDWAVLWRIAAPLARPAMLALAVLVFLASWNDLLLPLIYLSDDSSRTVSIGLTAFRAGRNGYVEYVLTAAGSTLVTVPIVALYVLLQRHFVRGLTAGATSG